MADKIYLGKNVESFSSSPRLSEYDMVILNIDDENYISSPYVTIDDSYWSSLENGEHVFEYDGAYWQYNGTAVSLSDYGLTVTYSSATAAKDGDTITVSKVTVDDEVTVTATLTRSGSVLEADCPLVASSVRQTVADDLLAKVIGFSYQPYTAGSALINPAAELGDAITAYGVYGGLYQQDITFDRLFAANIGAPASDEAEDESTYISATERKYTRKFAETSSEFTILASEISAKVSQTDGDTESFGWTLTSDGWSVYSGGTTVLSVDSDGLTVSGTITAKDGYIGNGSSGFTIGSRAIYNGMTSRDDTENTGVYIGTNGIALGGGKFKVTSSGKLTATSGTFTGSVYAGSIKYGGTTYGTMSGSGITSSSITTTQTGSGINTSLGYADFSNNVFNGISTATSISCSSLIVYGSQYTKTTISFYDYYGNLRSWNVLATS